MTVHHLEPEAGTLHGQYAAHLPPALTVRSGDVVQCRTLDVAWSDQARAADGSRPVFGPRVSPRDDGPALLGPIAVEGARPGMILEVQLRRIVPGAHGWTSAGELGPLNAAVAQALGVGGVPPRLLRWSIDRSRGLATSDGGWRVRLRPFLGMIGVCPGGEGWFDGWTPRHCGGNLDCRELIEGTTISFPVEVPGALLSLGDGHAAQGDGEVAGSALECGFDLVELGLSLRDATPLEARGRRVRAVTPEGILAIGVGTTLDDAANDALRDMLDLLEETHGIDRHAALGLASVAAHLRVSQIANGVRGAHVLLPHQALERI